MTVTERPPLTRERIADAAVGFIDAHGLDALSMRKLGAELGVEAMSLYNHVANKADLLDAVSDRLYAEVLVAYGDPTGDWKERARALSHAYVDVAAAHPNAVTLLIHPASGSAAAQQFDERIVAAAALMTDDPRVGTFAFVTVANWVIGTIVTEHGIVPTASGRPRDDDDPIQHAADLLSAEEKFDEGLEVVLAGLEARYF
ncbi:MAG: TetR family transcriptional regulator [Actinomycetota bacterium]